MDGAARLRSYLKEKGMKPAAFARRVGVSRATAWRWINGERTPPVDFAMRIATATGKRVPVSSWGSADSSRHP